MKWTIKEIKEKGEPKDKVKFSALVKNVYEAKDATPAPGSKSKVISRQNIIVGDATDEMKVIVSHYSKSSEYDKSIIGKEVEVDGTLTEWEGKVNVFGKLIFKEGDIPQKEDASTTIRPATTSILPAGAEIRKVSLMGAIQFWGSHIGFAGNEEEIIVTAKKFEEYIRGTTALQSKIESKPIEKKELPKEETEQVIIPEQEKIQLINKVMELKEEQKLSQEEFDLYCLGKDIKSLSIEELKLIEEKLGGITDDIPF